MLPWFSVGALSACPRGAAMPLGASVLQCSWSRDGVTCLRSSCVLPQSLIVTKSFPPSSGVGFMALVRVPLPQAGAVF